MITRLQFESLLAALEDAVSHLEYCGYGDSWERECADDQKLPEKLDNAIERANKILEGTK